MFRRAYSWVILAVMLVAGRPVAGVEVALFAEVCGNLEALDAVLADISARRIPESVCLGGVIGYGANPNECIGRLRTAKIPVVRGQSEHFLDKDVTSFNGYARASMEWTKAVITPENKEWALKLPFSLNVHGAIAVNGTIHQPEEFLYVQTVADAQKSFDALKGLKKTLGFAAHSHVPVAFFGTDPITYSQDKVIPLEKDPVIINVGSVGQPRDEDPKACYQIWNTQTRTVTQVRLVYDIKKAQEKIRAAGLPEILAARLEHGK